jgi:glycine/D-amino acid oxidase-like deaminating enzyme
MNVCVVGAGIFGMAAALELHKRGHDVTLIERGEIPNPEASSTDVSKVIRRTNYPNEIYVELVTRAAAQWRAWHERTSRSIYFQTGKLIAVRDFGPEHEALTGWETLSRLGKDVFELTAEQVGKRFPQFAVSDEDRLFYDPWAGYLRSGQALADLATLARDSGVTIRENTLVAAVEETDSGVRVGSNTESEDCDRVVVAAGPWVAELLPAMETRVRITRQQMAFFAPKDPAPFRRDRFPVWSILSPDNLWYGFPYLHEGFVKVAEDSKVEDTEVDIAREPTSAFLAWAREFVAQRIPALSDEELVGGRSCLYTNMADMEDEQFVIDWAPGCERVLIAGCGCGHGFKFGGAIGPLIADALEDRENPLGDLFRIGNRFKRRGTD